MLNKVYNFGFVLRKVESRHVRLALVTATIICMVIGVGAPMGDGH